MSARRYAGRQRYVSWSQHITSSLRDSINEQLDEVWYPQVTYDDSGPQDSWIKPFDPYGQFTLFWNLIIIVWVLYQCLMIPYRIIFTSKIALSIFIFDICVQSLLLVDIGISMNTGIYSRGKLSNNRNETLKKYWHSWAFLDFISIIPFDWICYAIESSIELDFSITHHSSSTTYISRVLWCFSLVKILRIYKVRTQLSKFTEHITNLLLWDLILMVKLLIMLTMISHWGACGFYLISYEDRLNDHNIWIRVELDEDIEDVYITTLYWAFTTMTTVGYGDIHPESSNERWYCIFLMTMAWILFYYLIGKIGSAIAKHFHKEAEYMERSNKIKRYLKKMNIEADLQLRVRSYLQYKWAKQKRNTPEDSEIVDQLSTPLQVEVFQHIYLSLIQKWPLFFELYDTNFVSYLMKFVKKSSNSPNDIITTEGKMGNKIYFIKKGKVDIYHEASNTSLKELDSGSYFGEIAFFTGMPRMASVRWLTFTEMIYIQRSDFIDTLRFFPHEGDITDRLARTCIKEDLSPLKVHWYWCQELGHVAKNWDKILFRTNEEDVRALWLQKTQNLRKLNIENKHQGRKRKRRIKGATIKKDFGIQNVHGNYIQEHPSPIKFINERVLGRKVQAGNFRAAIDALKTQYEKRRPKYTIIMRTSSSEEDAQEDELEDPIREATFRFPFEKTVINSPVICEESDYESETESEAEMQTNEFLPYAVTNDFSPATPHNTQMSDEDYRQLV